MRRLMRGPASGQALMAYVHDRVGEEAYSQALPAARKAFQRDRERLRNELGVVWEYDAAEAAGRKVVGPDFVGIPALAAACLTTRSIDQRLIGWPCLGLTTSTWLAKPGF